MIMETSLLCCSVVAKMLAIAWTSVFCSLVFVGPALSLSRELSRERRMER